MGGDAKGLFLCRVTSCTFQFDFCRPAVQSEPRRQREAFQWDHPEDGMNVGFITGNLATHTEPHFLP